MATHTHRSKLVVGLASLALLGAAVQVAYADDDRGRGRGNGNYARQDDRGNRGDAHRGRGNEQRQERRGDDRKYADNNRRGDDNRQRQEYRRGDDGKHRQNYRGNDDGKHRQTYRAYDDGKHRQTYRRHDDSKYRQAYRGYDNDKYRQAYRRHDDGKQRRYYDGNKRYYGGQAYYGQHYRGYPRRGHVIHALPRNVVVVKHRHYNYWYGGGVWYAPRGPSYVVVAPPLGVFVSLLPSLYTTLWFGGIPYYYANDAYYVWRDYRRAYEVVEPPPGARVGSAAPASNDIFVYPGAGQGEEQVASDRYDCHRWASDETGFDPTLPAGGVPVDESELGRSEYLRAMTACLEARGYSVT